ncbi:unnamed protein product [Linum trigynum]|uniref:Bidirectional sugar transporter SWEET n=1 Tax=Linum trigynum TaxID=586398 RepID=A0AAV2G6B8_9ROSI
MAIFATQNQLVFTFGILGNIISFIVFLAPVPTFVRVWKKKSTQGFQSLPYIVSLFSSMIWLYYASLKPHAFLLITINSLGCLIQSIYIALYLFYAPNQTRMATLRTVVVLNLGGFCLILLLTHFFTSGRNRLLFLGWICAAFSVAVFAAPLTIMRLVIRTKSVEFMPFYLSFFLTLSAITWLFYGVFLKDIYVALPNIVGFMFGVVQMILYLVYKNMKTSSLPQIHVQADAKLPQQPTINVDNLIIAAARHHNNNDNCTKDVPAAAAACAVAATCPLPAARVDDDGEGLDGVSDQQPPPVVKCEA